MNNESLWIWVQHEQWILYIWGQHEQRIFVDMNSAWAVNLCRYEYNISSEFLYLRLHYDQRNYVVMITAWTMKLCKQCGQWIIVGMSSAWITNLCSYEFCEQDIRVVVNTVWTTNLLGACAQWTTSLETFGGIERCINFRSLASLSHTLLQEGGEFLQG